MTRVLITGASGFVGSRLMSTLEERFDLNLLFRNPSNISLKGFRDKVYIKDLSIDTEFSDCLEGVDVIVHCAAQVHTMSKFPVDEYRKLNVEATLNLAIQAEKSGVSRFIYLSSVKVNGEKTLNQNAFNQNSEYSPLDAYGFSKSEAEQKLLQLSESSAMEIVIIRPPLVYGPGVKANFASLMNLVSKGFPLPFGLINSNKRSLVSVANLVDLIVTCIKHPKAKNQVFLVSDDHDVSTSEMVKKMAVACGKKNFQLPIPVWCYKFAGKLFKKKDVVDRLIGSLQVDISHTKDTLDWTPPQSLEDGFKESSDYILNKRGNK